MNERNVLTQKRTASFTWWLGMAMCVAQAVCGILVAGGVMHDVMAGAVMGGFAGMLAYCNGNNPSLKGEY